MNNNQQYDVVVIGGGPAGSMAATMLAQKGWDVVLLEKQKHPRYVVGESLVPIFWKYADLIGVSDKLMAEGFIRKQGSLINWGNKPRAHTFKDFGFDRLALHVERDRFDEIILRHAESEGVTVLEEHQVSKVDLDDQPVVIHYRDTQNKQKGQITAQYVIDASGQAAVIGRQLGVRKFDDSFRFMSVWGYFEGARYLDVNGFAHEHEELEEVPPVTYISSLDETGNDGWSWYIALRDKTSVGIVFPNDSMKALKPEDESWEEYYERRVRAIPVVNELLADAEFISEKVHITRNYSYKTTQLAGPGYYLIGDAAGFVDPIFSVGIVLGVYSAYTAAWAIDESLKRPAQRDFYTAMYEKTLRGRLEVSRSLALPRYQPNSEISEEATQAIAFDSTHAQQLLKTLSCLTDRSDNFNIMTNNGEAIELNDQQLRVVEAITV